MERRESAAVGGDQNGEIGVNIVKIHNENVTMKPILVIMSIFLIKILKRSLHVTQTLS